MEDAIKRLNRGIIRGERDRCAGVGGQGAAAWRGVARGFLIGGTDAGWNGARLEGRHSHLIPTLRVPHCFISLRQVSRCIYFHAYGLGDGRSLQTQ